MLTKLRRKLDKSSGDIGGLGNQVVEDERSHVSRSWRRCSGYASPEGVGGLGRPSVNDFQVWASKPD